MPVSSAAQGAASTHNSLRNLSTNPAIPDASDSDSEESVLGNSAGHDTGRLHDVSDFREKMDGSVVGALQEQFFRLQTKSEATGTEPLHQGFGWEDGEERQQHDTQELIRMLLDRVEKQCLESGEEGARVAKELRGVLEGE